MLLPSAATARKDKPMMQNMIYPVSKACVFIDGGYFQKVLEKDFGRIKVDFEKVSVEL